MNPSTHHPGLVATAIAFALLIACETAAAQAAAAASAAGPSASAAAAAEPVSPLKPTPVLRPAPHAAPSIANDPQNQAGAAAPVAAPQVRIPFGKKNATEPARPRTTSAAEPLTPVDDDSARCEALRGEQVRRNCLDKAAREAGKTLPR